MTNSKFLVAKPLVRIIFRAASPMKQNPKAIRNALFSIIREVVKNVSTFVRDPERDFMAEKSELTKKDAGAALDAFTIAVQDALLQGDKVQLVGFGTFEVKERTARTGKNPRTGEAVEIAAAKVPAFKVGKVLKDALN